MGDAGHKETNKEGKRQGSWCCPGGASGPGRQAGALFLSAVTSLQGQHLPIRLVPGVPAASSSAASPWPSQEVCSLSLIGIETHSPPFSCRWGFHRKKLLLCFPRIATVWKLDPYILLDWVKSLLARLLPIVGSTGPTGTAGDLTSSVQRPLGSLQMKMAWPGNPARSIII